MTVTITKAVIGGSENSWGQLTNNSLDTIVNHLNSSTFTPLDGAASNQVVNSKAVIYGSGGQVAATTVELGNWSISESGGSLRFSYNGSVRFSISSSGDLVASGNVTGYGTP
jgi:hypothetical protein